MAEGAAKDPQSGVVIGAAIAVHRALGPGLLESVYEACLCHELKSVERVLPVHIAQLITYLRLGKFRRGLLINFNVPRLVDGVTRVVL